MPPPARPGPSARTAPRTSVGPGAGEQQRDVRAEAAAEHGGLAELGERGVGVGHQDLGGVAAADRHGRSAVAGEVEPPDRPGPGLGGCAGTVAGRALAEAVEQQQRAARRRARSSCSASSTWTWRSMTVRRSSGAPASVMPGTRAPVGDVARLLDVHEVAGAVERHEAGAGGR